MAAGKRGGARPNSGPKPGTKYAPTLAKEAAREAVRVVIMQHIEPLVKAQIANAQGLSYLVGRDKAGKFARLSASEIKKALAGESEYTMVEVWAKDPSVQAFTDLMNRALDKPREQVQEIEVTGGQALIDLLYTGRQRAAKRGK